MKAYRAHRLAGLQSLALEDAEPPEPGQREVVIAVEAVGLHLADVAALAGERAPRPALPFTPGLEVAGKIVACGARTKGREVGRRVVAFLPWGGLAEQASARAGLCVDIPDNLSVLQAAALPIDYAGALLALEDKGEIKSGHTVLVLGAGGQAGLAAIRVAKLLGATVIGITTGEARLTFAREHGADHVVDAGLVAFTTSVETLTESRGVDIVYDPVGGDASQAAVSVLAQGGRLISAGFASGRPPAIDFTQLFARGAQVRTANTVLEFESNATGAHRALERVVGWAAGGQFEPRIAAQFAFADARPAFDYVVGRRGSGAVIVKIGA
jgi:NADPH2:quinone reductase